MKKKNKLPDCKKKKKEKLSDCKKKEGKKLFLIVRRMYPLDSNSAGVVLFLCCWVLQ
jgi:hypothetical protein